MSKNKYIKFVNAIVLLSILLSGINGISVSASDAAEDKAAYYLIDEDFNSLKANNDDPLENWGWDVIEDGGTVSYVPNEEFLMTDDSSTKRLAIKRDFQTQTGGTMTWDFKFSHKEAMMAGTSWELLGDGKTAVKISVGEKTVDSEYYPLRAQNTHLMGVAENTLYGIRVVINLDNHTYSVYADGIRVGTNISYDSDVTCIDSMVVATGAEATGSMYCRPVRLSRGYIIAEQFIPYGQNTLNSGTNTYWTFLKSGGDVKTANMNSTTPPDILSVCLEDTSESNYVQLRKAFDTVSDNLIWQFKFYAPDGMNDFEAKLGSCTLKGKDNNLYLVTKTEDYMLCENIKGSIWYTIKINYKQTTGMADVAVNGKSVCTDKQVANAGASSYYLRYKTGSQTTDTVWLDDIYLSYDLPLPDDYVPEPVVLKKDANAPLIGMQTCDLWREGKHFGWDKIARNPRVKPYLGYYDDGSAEVKDWEIKYMAEHGVDFSMHTWFRPEGAGKPIKDPRNGSSLHDGLFNAQYKDKIKFAIEWDPATYVGKGNYVDFQQYIIPFWMEYYFKDPSYMKIDNKPVIGLMAPDYIEQVFSDVGVASQIEYLREQCIANGFDGAYILAVSSTSNEYNLNRYKDFGFDGTYAYNYDSTYSIEEQKASMTKRREANILPAIPTIVTGMDCALWNREGGGVLKPAEVNELALWVKNTALKENTMSEPGPDNLIADGIFESCNNGDVPDNITLGSVVGVIEEGSGVGGTNAVKISDTAANQSINIYFPVEAGKEYEVSLDLKRTATASFNAEKLVTMEIYGNGGANYIGSAFKNEKLSYQSAYKTMKTRFTAPVTGSNGRLKLTLEGTATGVYTYIDNIKCSELTKSIGEKLVMLGNWNEYGEGYFFMPTNLAGFDYLEAIGRVFGQPAHTDIKPTQNQIKRLCRLYPTDRVVETFPRKTYEQRYNSLMKWDFNDSTDSMPKYYNVKDVVVQDGIFTATTTTADPQLVTADNLSIKTDDVDYIRVRMKNPGTSSIGSKLYFVTNEDKTWNEAKSISWTIDKGMTGFVDYFVDVSANANWKGTLKQIRFDPFEATGSFAYDTIELLGAANDYNKNIVKDGGMEDEQLAYSAENVTADITAWDYQSGYRSLSCKANDNGRVTVDIPVRQGHSYQASVVMKSEAATFDAKLAVEYMHKGSQKAAELVTRQVSQDGWSVVEGVANIPADGTVTEGKLTIVLPKSAECYIDRIEVYEIPYATMGFYDADDKLITTATAAAGDVVCKVFVNNVQIQESCPAVWVAKYENGTLCEVLKYERESFSEGNLQIPAVLSAGSELRCGMWDADMAPVLDSIKIKCE